MFSETIDPYLLGLYPSSSVGSNLASASIVAVRSRKGTSHAPITHRLPDQQYPS